MLVVLVSLCGQHASSVFLCSICSSLLAVTMERCVADESKTDSEVLPVLTFQQPASISSLERTEQLQCLKCDLRYDLPAQKDDYLAHLFLAHRLVIADIEEIALLEDYLQFWQNEFKGKEFEEYCTTMLLDQLPDGTAAKNEKYYLLSDILPKDYELRKQLQQERLEKALARHQYELTDRNFSKECLYCRDIITGLRADFLEHLFSKHFLQLGKPENLVYVDELLAKVQQNLEHLICLYCEKVFKDRMTLKEHMRKKAHKRINPNNRAYDKFFLLHYRNEKPTKSRDFRTQRKHNAVAAVSTVKPKEAAAPAMSDRVERHHTNTSEGAESVDFERRFCKSDESDSDWSDWDGESAAPLNCLFCPDQEPTFDSLKAHMTTHHHVNFEECVKGLNFYQKIKVVNYVRRQICLLRCVTCNIRCESQALLTEHMTAAQHYGLGEQKQWDKPEYFFPTYEDDGLLCILDDSPNDDLDDTVVRIISEDSVAQINKDAERLSLENFNLL